MDIIQMSTKEINRLEILEKVKTKQMTQRIAAEILKLSVRHVKRLVKAYREQGAIGLVSKRRGKPGNNQIKQELKQKVVDALYSTYTDFGPTLAQEKIAAREGLKISVSSVRKIMIEEGLWKPKKTRRAKIHQLRERRACFGELVQIDGSPHDWFEGRSPKCTLLAFIDDATGALLQLKFVKSESFFSYAQTTGEYISQYGKPVAFYSDKNSIFKVNQASNSKTDALTQFSRAMLELDIEVICAESPQAKGRVERLFETLQDRLPKELRLAGINDMEEGNAYLPTFIKIFNKRFAVKPRSTVNAHRPLAATDHLARILTWQEDRILSKNLTLQYKHTLYQIKTDRPSYALINAPVKVCEDASGQVLILYKDRPLDYSIYHRQAKQALVIPSKDITSVLDKKRQTHKPAPDHPWRRGFATPLSNRSATKGDIST
jgi:transposase